MKKWRLFLIVGAALTITGCSPEAGKAASGEAVETSAVGSESQEEASGSVKEEETEPTEKEKRTVQGGNSLEDLAALLGMQDSETEDLLGGGEENWTEDHSFYIGRIYQAEMYGETYPVYTTCSSQGIVDSVSLRIVSGERQVTSEEVQEWTERLTEQTGVSPVEDEARSEGGSLQKRWRKDGKVATMDQMEDILTISLQKSAGELDTGKQEPTASQNAAEDDNFSVDPADAEAFALQIKAAVEKKDLEALADLAAYPLYVGSGDGGKSVESREEFIALGQDAVFTEERMASVAGADETKLSPSRAGFVLSDGKGGPNIIFGLRNGKLAISGMND